VVIRSLSQAYHPKICFWALSGRSTVVFREPKSECLPSSKAVIQVARIEKFSTAAFGQTRSFAYCVFLRFAESIGIDDAD